MKPVHAALSEFGLEIRQSPNLSEIRLPARLRFSTAIALACVGLITISMWAGFTSAAIFTGGISAIGLWIVATVVALATACGLHRVVSWHRYGVVVSVTPDQLIVKPHWATLEASNALRLSRVHIEETRRAIVISQGRRKVKIGTALSTPARHAVVEFLSEVSAGYTGELLPEDGGAPEPEAIAQPCDTTDGAMSGFFPPAVAEWDLDPIEIRILALCQRFLEFDLGDVHLAPMIPQPVFAAAAQSYLDIKNDETLLAIVGVKEKGPATLGCGLTTKRIYWPGKMRSSADDGPPRCHSLEYELLPIILKGLGGTGVILGDGHVFALQGNKPLRDALVQSLGMLRSMATGKPADRDVPDADRANARLRWPRVAVANTEARALQAEIRTFESRMIVASRPVVTRAIALVCAVVFVAMFICGVSVRSPTVPQLIAWGAIFGPSVVFDHDVWRLFTAMFVHIGFMHILLNVSCLVAAGPLVERFFGHVGFAALYVIAGIGGSVASLWAHPTSVGAGASGAIFGIFGGLLGLLAIRYREVPPAVLKPMRGAAITFIGYNMLFGLMVPKIDTAAHLGGLATGFVCGLVMALVSRVHTTAAARVVPATLRLAAAGAVMGVLAVVATKVIDVAGAQILADPNFGPLLTSEPDFAQPLNAFSREADPLLSELVRIAGRVSELSSDLIVRGIPAAKLRPELDRLKAECGAIGEKVAAIPAQGAELLAIRKRIASAQSHQLEVLQECDRFIATGNSHVVGPDGIVPAVHAFEADVDQAAALRDAYIKSHNLRIVKDESGP
jgi:rhomboid protease GluP